MDADAPIRFGRFELQPHRRQLLVDSRPVPLGARAQDLLQRLIERRDRVVSKGELLDLVWPRLVVEEANLHVQISSLRKVLGDGVIATVPGRGYRFVAPCDATDHGPPMSSPAAAPAAAGPALIGREADLAALAAMLREFRAITVVGPPGVGKTRLVREAVGDARVLREAAEVAWVDCATMQSDLEVLQGVAQALKLPLASVVGGDPDRQAMAERLAGAIAGRRVLLVLDNCEHVRDGAAAFAAALAGVRADGGPDLLATSIAPLGSAGQGVLRLAPLALPADDSTASEADPAIRLFADRVRLHDRAFSVGVANAADVARVCRMLDGLPLAIELAAARVGLLGVRGLAERLDDRFRLLTRGADREGARHRTLRAALEWSLSLLDANEAVVFRRLGSCVGGFPLELAERLAADGSGTPPLDRWAVLDALGGLVDRSLVVAEPGEPVRFHMLESMRALALEQLEAAGEGARLRERHARVVGALVVAIDEAAWGDAPADGPAGTSGFDPSRELDNVRAALDWALAHGAAGLAVDLAGRTAPHAFQRGLAHRWVPLLRECLPHLPDASPAGRVALLWRLSQLGRQEGMPFRDLDAMKSAAVDGARAAGFRRRLLPLLGTLGFAEADHGDLDKATAIAAEMRGLATPDLPPKLQVQLLMVEAKLHERRRDFAAAAAASRLIRACLLDLPGEVANLMNIETNLSIYLNQLGRHAEAAETMRDTLRRPERTARMTHHVHQLVYALAMQGETEEALRTARTHRADLEANAAAVDLHGRAALAALAVARGRVDDAWRIAAPVIAASEGGRAEDAYGNLSLNGQWLAVLRAATEASRADPDTVRRWRDDGERLSARAAIALALD